MEACWLVGWLAGQEAWKQFRPVLLASLVLRCIHKKETNVSGDERWKFDTLKRLLGFEIESKTFQASVTEKIEQLAFI